MLKSLFRSEAAVKLLSLLFFCKQSLHIRELARRTNVSPIYVKRELERLQSLGLVLNKRVGNLSIWEANKASPIYSDLKNVFLKTECLGSVLQKAFERLGIRFAFVYGSFAKGTEKPNSDVDLFVVGKVGDEFLKSVLKAEEKVCREINYVAWTEKEFLENAGKSHHLLQDIAKNPVIWLKGDENEFRKIVGRRLD